MANNRIYLRCKNCGDGIFLGKCFGAGYFTNDRYYGDNTMIEKLNQFYEDHTFCDKPLNKDMIEYLEPKFRKEDVYCENQFEIAYEYYREEK